MTVLSLCGFTQSCYCVIVIDALYYSYLQDPKHVSVTSFFCGICALRKSDIIQQQLKFTVQT